MNVNRMLKNLVEQGKLQVANVEHLDTLAYLVDAGYAARDGDDFKATVNGCMVYAERKLGSSMEPIVKDPADLNQCGESRLGKWGEYIVGDVIPFALYAVLSAMLLVWMGFQNFVCMMLITDAYFSRIRKQG